MANPVSPSAHMLGLVDIALAAGRAIMDIYGQDFSARQKGDLTPVTDADEAAERIILADLAKFDATTPIISEEAASAGRIPKVEKRFYLVDPLDGTKEFINRNGEFTVNIALVEDGIPVAGVVYAPALRRLFIGERGAGAAQAQIGEASPSWQVIATRPPHAGGLTVVASRSHRDEKTEEFLKTIAVLDLVSAGSSLKFCLLAAGEADLYPRFGRTMEWDTAAGHAVLLAAGGEVAIETGAPLVYGKAERGYDNPAFIAAGKAALIASLTKKQCPAVSS